MNKIEQHKTKLLSDYMKNNADDAFETAFKDGFDACMDLQLPVKFAEWKENVFNNDRKEFEIVLQSFPNSFPEYKELFVYWIENIYKPE